MKKSFKIYATQRLQAAPNKALLSPVKDLTLSTLETIAKDSKDPRQQQAQREAERRKQQYNQSKAPERAREKADKARKQATKNRDKTLRKQQQQKNRISPANSRSRSTNLDVMKSPLAQ